MIDVATQTVSCRIQPLSGDAVSSSTSRRLRRVKPELPRSPTTGCSNKETNHQTKKHRSHPPDVDDTNFSQNANTTCVLCVSATSRVRVACAVIAFPRSVPVYAKAPTTVVAPRHDLLMATSSRLSILSKAWSVHWSEPVHDNEHSCVRPATYLGSAQTTTRRHSTQGSRETHIHTEIYTDQQKDSDRDTIRERYGKRR